MSFAAASAPGSAIDDDSNPIPGPRTSEALHLGKPTFFLDGAPFTSPVFETYVPESRYFRHIEHIQHSDYSAHLFGTMVTGMMTEERT
jgi:hypothetical protein